LIVYVETNFVLELAYLRPTSDSCQRLLALARDGKIRIVVPAFALIEARIAWQRNIKRRNRLLLEVRAELGELSRSSPLSDIASQSQAFVSALVDTADQDRRRLESALEALRQQTTVLPTEPAIVPQAYVAELGFGLSPQDAIIYVTVLDHAGRREGSKLFVTQNANDFRVPQIEEELSRNGCKLLVTFDAAEAYVRKEIGG
jgi:predicted nucleic acid-binding protein